MVEIYSGRGSLLNVKIEICESNILAKFDNFVCEVAGNFDKAQDVKKIEDTIKQAFEKTGGTPFSLKSIQIDNPQNLFVPISIQYPANVFPGFHNCGLSDFP